MKTGFWLTVTETDTDWGILWQTIPSWNLRFWLSLWPHESLPIWNRNNHNLKEKHSDWGASGLTGRGYVTGRLWHLRPLRITDFEMNSKTFLENIFKKVQKFHSVQAGDVKVLKVFKITGSGNIWQMKELNVKSNTWDEGRTRLNADNHAPSLPPPPSSPPLWCDRIWLGQTLTSFNMMPI